MLEQLIINAVLEDNDLISELSFLEAKHFAEYSETYEAILNTYEEHGKVSSIDLMLINIDYPVIEETVTKDSVIKEAKKMFDDYQLNFLRRGIKKIKFNNVDEVLNNLTLLIEAVDNNYESSVITKPINIQTFIEEMREIRKSEEVVGLIVSSLPTFNKITGGILPTDLIGIYGKEKSSKTTLTHEIVLDICLIQKKSVLIFNFEMDVKQLLMKTMSMRTGIDVNALRNPKYSGLTDQDFEIHAEEIIKDFEGSKLFIVDEILDEYQIYNKTKELIKAYGIGLIVIDYLMLIEPKLRFKERREALNYLTRFFKRMAKKLNMAIILVSQSNDSGQREAEAKGLSRDSNYYFYVEALDEGQKVEIGDTKYSAAKGDYLVINRGIRHGKGNRAFLTRFIGNKYYEIDTNLKYGL